MLVEYDDELEWFLFYIYDNVGLVFDIGYVFVVGVEILCVLYKYGYCICYLYLKDVCFQVLGCLYWENLSFNEVVCVGLFIISGDGCIDYVLIFDFVWDSDYCGWLIIEVEQDLVMVLLLVIVSCVYVWLVYYLFFFLLLEEYVL